MNLSQKINLVFAEERRLYGIPSKATIGSLNIGEFVPTGLLAATSEIGYVKSINADRLLKLHSMLDQHGRQHFENYLFSHLRNGIVPESQLSYLSFLVLHRLGQTIAAVQAARHYYTSAGKSGRPEHGRRTFGNVAITLSALIATEYGQMSGAWCEELHAALGSEISLLPSLRDRLNQGLLMHLDAELGDANPEIFADRDRVISIWERRFGDPTIPAVIAEIDQYFRAGETSEVRLATCASRIRTLLAKVALAVAQRHAQQGGPAVSPTADEHAVFQHLRSAKLLDDHEWNLLRSLYSKASNEGSHSLTAKLEETRLVKNMAYEFLLLLLSRTS